MLLASRTATPTRLARSPREVTSPGPATTRAASVRTFARWNDTIRGLADPGANPDDVDNAGVAPFLGLTRPSRRARWRYGWPAQEPKLTRNESPDIYSICLRNGLGGLPFVV